VSPDGTGTRSHLTWLLAEPLRANCQHRSAKRAGAEDEGGGSFAVETITKVRYRLVSIVLRNSESNALDPIRLAAEIFVGRRTIITGAARSKVQAHEAGPPAPPVYRHAASDDFDRWHQSRSVSNHQGT